MTVLNHTPASVTTRRGLNRKRAPARPDSLGGRPPHPVTIGAYDSVLLAGIADGKSTAAIGAEMGCNGKTIRMRLDVLAAQGVGVPEKPSTLHPVTQGLHDEAILTKRADGVSYASIGREFRCSDRLVSGRVKVILAAQKPAPVPVAPPPVFASTKPKARERRCLGGCGRMRASEGPGDRVCRNCKGTEVWRSGGDLALSGARIHDR